MIWRAALVFVICQTIYCQSAIGSNGDLKENSEVYEDNFSAPTTTFNVQPDDKNHSNSTENYSDDELHFDDDNIEYWTEGEPHESENINDNVKNDSGVQGDTIFNATDQISDRLPPKPIQNNDSTTSEVKFLKKFPEPRNDSSQSDLTDIQSKVVLSQAVKPTTYNSFYPKQEESLLDRADENFSKSKESQKRVGPYGSHLPSYLKTHHRVPSQINSEIASNLPFPHHGAASISELSKKLDSDLQNLFYRPSTHPDANIKLNSARDGIADKDTLFSNHKYSRGRIENEDERSQLYDSDRQKNPEVTRKVTVVKEKTMRSISKTEEQESVTIPEKPQERFSSGESIILKSETTGNSAIGHPKGRAKEETIVLVEGSHIPGKNYGPEDDLFGYHYNFYENNPQSLQSGQLKDITQSDDKGHSSHRIQHSNHGNGVSTQFFSSSPPNNLKGSQPDISLHENHYESNRKSFPVNIQFKHDDEESSNPGLGTVHLVPKNDPTLVKCHHNHEHSLVSNEPEITHEEIDPNQLYIDAHTGQLIKFVPEDQAQSHFPETINDEGNKLGKDSGTWPQPNFDASNYPNNDFSQDSSGSSNNKGKIKTRSTSELKDLSNIDLTSNSAFNKPNNEHNYQKQDISNKNFEFDVTSENIKLNSDSDLNSHLDSQFTHIDFEGTGKAKTGDVGSILFEENPLSNKRNRLEYGGKLKIGGSDFTLPNEKEDTEHNLKSFPQVSKNLLENYEHNNVKSFESLSGILNRPAKVNLEEHNFGTKLGSGNYKGNNKNQHSLFPKPKTNSYIRSNNEDTDTYKKVYFEYPTKEGNKNFNMPITNGKSGLNFHIPTGNNKGTEFIISDDENEGHNLYDCIKPQKHFNGQSFEAVSGQSYNKGSGMDIRKHPNYMVSLQNLYGFKSKGFPMGNRLTRTKKKSFANFQTQSYPEANNEYLPKHQFNSKTQSVPQFQRQFHIKGQKLPNSSLKGLSFQNSGINNHQYGSQNNGKFDDLSFNSPGIITEHHGGANLHGHMQHQAPDFQHNSLNAFNGIYRQQEPAEYILVELDDNGKGHTDSEIESYYRQYENNLKGEQVELSHANRPNVHSFAESGDSNKHLQSPNIRYVVKGRKDVTFPLRRLATTGFHMARSVLPLMTNTKPKSIQGNINFGLQFSKRKGPSNDINKNLEAARN